MNLYQAQHLVHQLVYHLDLPKYPNSNSLSIACQETFSRLLSYDQGIVILFCPGNGLVSGSLAYLHQIYMVHLHRMFHQHIHRCQGSRVCDLYLILYYLHSIQDRKCISILPVQLEDNLSALDKDHLVQKIHRVIHTDMAFKNNSDWLIVSSN